MPIGDRESDTGLSKMFRKKKGALDGNPAVPANAANRVPAIYIAKYNRFVDNILDKLNKVLSRSYDPVSVRLQPVDANKKANKKNNIKKTTKRKASSKKKNGSRVTKKEESEENLVEKNENQVKTKSRAGFTETKPVDIKSAPSKTNRTSTKTTSSGTKSTSATKSNKADKKKKNQKGTKKNEKSKPKARGTLYGLSSLRRDGDVIVNIMSDHTTVKTNFMMGPLILKVEKEIGRGANKELKSATATTAEMVGKLNLRISNSGVATLHSIRVLQPKQVRVESDDKHESTREFVWRRSARIAHVVSRKLTHASRPMFRAQ